MNGQSMRQLKIKYQYTLLIPIWYIGSFTPVTNYGMKWGFTSGI